MTRLARFSPAAFGLILICAAPVHAEAPMQTEAPVPVEAGVDSSPKVAELAAAVTATPLDDDNLAEFRGGQAITIANQTMTSIVSGASIGGDVTAGAVSLTDNALSSFNGLGNIVINTGSQVSLQSGMNVIVNVNQ